MSQTSPPKSSIFRKVSLERLSSPEQLDTAMRATDPQGWLALVTIAMLLGAALTWSVLAWIPSKVNGTGIILRGHGMQEVFSPTTGVIGDIYAKPGDTINKGEKLGMVLDAESWRKMRELQATMDTARRQMTLIPPEQRTDLEREIKSLQVQYDQAASAAAARGAILSPYHGRILEVVGEMGDLVQAGTHVFYVEPLDVDLQALLYVSASDAGRISKGMAVQINPDSARREEYGCMVGTVEEINLYPSSAADLQRKFGNDQLVAALLAGRTAVQATVSLNKDADTFSRFQWSSGKGPPFEIRTGTLCTGSVIVSQQHPIDLVLP